jgi:hypothetical protein
MADITVTVSLDESEQRAIEQQLLRNGLSETVEQLVTRITQKNIDNWAAENRNKFVDDNLGVMKQIVLALAVDPQRDAKLAAMGYRLVNGRLIPL